MMSPRYDRPRLKWITTRARRLMRLPDASRRTAVRSAIQDYNGFVRPGRLALTVIAGGRR